MKIIFFLLLSAPLFVRAQSELPTKNGKVFYEVVDSSVTGTADELYDRAKLWMVDVFRDSKEVIQLDDKSASTLVGKGNYNFTNNMMIYTIKFSIKINTKENKYRAQIYDLLVTWNNGTLYRPIEDWLAKKAARNWLEKADKEVKDIIKHLQKAMPKKIDNDF